MKHTKRIFPALLSLLLAAGAAGCGQNSTDVKEPVTIDVWHYYNGDQQSMFDQLVKEFNDSIGKEKGIIVEAAAQGSVSDLETKVLASINGEVGASELPNIFASYTATAFVADSHGLVVNLRDFMSEDELSSYVEGYIAEGDFSGDGDVKLFPIAKSTEVLVLNQTDWDKFASETGASRDALATTEGLVSTAQHYYEWTDAKTPDIPNDGKAFFGRDSMSNYLLVGGMQLNTTIFDVEDGKLKLNFDETAIRKLWDHYYVPYIKGYFTAMGHFRSDDLKTGAVISYAGSSAGALYIPSEVSISDTESYPIEVDILPAPQFENSFPCAVQQGASMVVTTASEEEIQASVEFLKWFTDEAQNIKFAVQSSYLPVKKTANTHEAVFGSGFSPVDLVEKALSTAIDTVNANYMYTPQAFNTGIEARADLEALMRDQALADRKTVVERLESGLTLEQATEEFCSDNHFHQWYKEASAVLKQWETP